MSIVTELNRHTVENEVLLAAVLHDVNEIRTAVGMVPLHRLPKGTPRKAQYCVLAKALSNGWTARATLTLTILENSNASAETLQTIASDLRARGYKAEISLRCEICIMIKNTPAMNELILRFDNDRLPQLVHKNWTW